MAEPRYIAVVFARSTKTGIGVLLGLLLGLPWAMLQSVAWTGMILDFARTSPLRIALIKTFDGKHPCKLCQFIAKARSSERKQDRHSSTGKLDPFSTPAIATFVPPPLESLAPRTVRSTDSRVEPPPTPPPITQLLG